MAIKEKCKIAERIVEEYGQTFSEELKIHVEKNTPSNLFRTLCLALLASTRISHNAAVQAARALSKEGWTTAEKMAAATWRQRTDVLNRSGYARYDESTSRMLQDTSELLLDKYKGDLRKLRKRAENKPDEERKLLKEFKGIGDVGVDIFFREVQVAWEEVFPFADNRVLKAAKTLGLGDDANELLELTTKKDFPHLAAGLVRVELEKAYDQLEV